MNDPLLSVIVPCYNGEKFIKKCIDSIIKQTYVNLEILIIDDGSTDNSYQICMTLAEHDPRIRIIHQENKGSSLTRKIGVENVNGDYVTFVDADDWIHPQMYEFMMKGMLREDADIAQCGVCNVLSLPNGQYQLKHRKCSVITDEYQTYNRIDGTLRILSDVEWQSYVWNKIYKKELFKNVIFPIGRFLDEDLSIMHQLYHQADKSIYFLSEFYYYLSGSLTQPKNDKHFAKKIIDRCNARWERYLFTKEHKEYSSMLNKMHNIYISVTLAAIRWDAKHPGNISQHDIDIFKERIKNNPLSLKKQMKEFFSLGKKVEYQLFRRIPALYEGLLQIIK